MISIPNFLIIVIKKSQKMILISWKQKPGRLKGMRKKEILTQTRMVHIQLQFKDKKQILFSRVLLMILMIKK